MNSNLIMLIFLLRKPTPQAYNMLTEYLQIENLDKINEQSDLIQDIVKVVKTDIQRIKTMHQFHQMIGETLRDLKQQQKVQSGSVVDLFARNMLLLFNQMEFTQLIKAWENFQQIKENYLQNNPFLVDSQLDYILTQLEENSTLIDISQIKQSLEEDSLNENPKINYIKALLYSITKQPFKAIKHSRRFYDLSLNQLVNKKVNHCIMNSIQLNMKMNLYDEALNSLSEGLRLSQTVSDELSINTCLLNLYEIAYRNNNQKQSTLILEYAVNHALQLSQMHKLQNCLIYGSHIRYRQLHHSLLKKKQINWKDIINQSLKQLVTSYIPEIQSSLSSYVVINSIYYGNATLVELALEQIENYKKNDILIQQILSTLESLILYDSVIYLEKVIKILSISTNLNDQMILQIISICWQLFEQIGDINALKYLKIWSQQILEISPDPYLSEFFGIIPGKNPKICCKQMLEQRNIGLLSVELIKLCKNYQLDQEYLQYKLINIQELINENDFDQAKQNIQKINLNKFSQSNCQTKATYWNLMGQLYKNEEYYKNSIEEARKISNLELIRSNYYELAILNELLNNELKCEYYSEQFNKVELLISSCQQNRSIQYYKLSIQGIVEYLYRFIKIIENEFKCEM